MGGQGPPGACRSEGCHRCEGQGSGRSQEGRQGCDVAGYHQGNGQENGSCQKGLGKGKGCHTGSGCCKGEGEGRHAGLLEAGRTTSYETGGALARSLTGRGARSGSDATVASVC